MLALTIHNPYAHLITTPQAELPRGAVQKRVENRSWPTEVRGEIAIHAGVSMEWFDNRDWPMTDDQRWPARRGPRGKLNHDEFPMMSFGAIVGVADIVECLSLRDAFLITDEAKFGWVAKHHHSSGPYCFVLDNIRRLESPVVCTGRQKFWNVPATAERQVLDQLSDMRYSRAF